MAAIELLLRLVFARLLHIPADGVREQRLELTGCRRPSAEIAIHDTFCVFRPCVVAQMIVSKQQAIQVDGEKVSGDLVLIHDGSVIKVGKRRFLRLVK